MKKKFFILLIFLFLFFITGCNNKNIDNTGGEIKRIMSLNINIDNKEYKIDLEQNETVDTLINMLPLTTNMKDLNNNEKYTYLDKSLPTNEYIPKTIHEGDVMLYGNNCLVIFYKTFSSSYSYTKIGHIKDLPELNNTDVTVKIDI